MKSKFASPRDATLYDWALLALIVAFGGSSFVMIRNAVETVPPAAVAAGRLWVAAALLYGVMRAGGLRLPPFFIRKGTRSSGANFQPPGDPDSLAVAPARAQTRADCNLAASRPGRKTGFRFFARRSEWRIRRSWLWMIAVGAVGNVLPFYIFPWAQQHVESGLAGVYMAFMPIWTVALAYLFAGERLSGRKLFGFGLGFAGVIVLMGPDVLKGALSSNLAAQAGLLFATFLYGASAVLSRRAPAIPPRVFAAGMLIVAAAMAVPALFFTDLQHEQWTAASIASIVFLGVFPTGLNGMLIIMLIRRAGAGFMSLANYITPLWAVALGAVTYHERLGWTVFLALAVILAGVAVSQRSPFGRKRAHAIAASEGIAGDLAPMAGKPQPQTKI